MRFGSTAKVLAECNLTYYRNSECLAAHLGLDGVERLEVGVQGLKLGVPEGRDGERLQVQQLSGWRVLFRQDEVAEGDGQHCLARQPLVRDHLQLHSIASVRNTGSTCSPN